MKFWGPPVGLVLAVAASVAAHFFAYGWFVVETCGVSDQAQHFPAQGSLQGTACGVGAVEVWNVPGVWALAFSTVLAVALAVVVWSKGGSWRWVSPLALAVVPALTLVLISLPPDTCSADARHTHTPYQCQTSPSG